MTSACNCNSVSALVFSCSGAADVGELADRAARALTRAGHGKMFCLAGVGGAVPNILEQTGLASKVLAIDGCPTACASATLKKAGFSRFTRLQLADLGFNKGSTDPTTENIDRIVTAAKQNLK